MTHTRHDGVTVRQLAPVGAVSATAAAVLTTGVAAIARAAGVDLEVDGTTVPLPAFAWWTVVGAVLGVVLARLLADAVRLAVTASVLTVLSLVPAIALPDDLGTRLVLVATHLVAAAIVVPSLSRRLATLTSVTS